MSNLIDRDALLEVLKIHAEFDEKYANRLLGEGAKEIADIIHASYEKAVKDMPTIDTVKHGKWIETSSGDHWKCSRCNCRAGFWFNEENSCEWSMDMSEWLSDFCPNCGARMEGEEE